MGTNFGFTIRIAGAGLIALAWLAGRALIISPSAVHGSPSLFDYLLALLAFLGLSAGGMLAVLGSHIFDPVEVSERWRIRGLHDQEL